LAQSTWRYTHNRDGKEQCGGDQDRRAQRHRVDHAAQLRPEDADHQQEQR
jgi:hypothetical protein